MNDRARVPFALLGVVLLVGSTTYAASLQGPTASEPRVAEAMEEFSAESRTAMMEAARDAAMAAAADPVTSRAATPAGNALGEGTTFRDALRLRVYTRVRRALDDLGRRQSQLRLSASLPVPETEAELRRAVKRVTVERAGPNGTELRVTVEGVRLTARRNGQTAARVEVSPTFRVAVPTLAVHDRVALFERRLDAGPTEPGLGRQLTASLYPLAWTRGYAQYAGTPIENVVANRHVALATNGAVLDIQRSVFGTSDPVGRHALEEATARAAISDALKGSGNAGLKTLERARGHVVDPSPLPDQTRLGERAREQGPSPEENVTVGVNATADRAFLSTFGPEAEVPLAQRLDRHYEVDVRRRVDATLVADRRIGPAVQPEENWTRTGSARETTTSVSERTADPPDPDGDWHVLAHHQLRVVRRVTERQTWATPGGTRTTETQRVVRVDVTVLLTGNHAADSGPRGKVDPVHARGGPLDGPNLADVRETARERLLASDGGAVGVARAVVSDGPRRLERRATAMERERTVTGSQPPGLEAWVYRDLADLRRRVANLSMTASQGDVATFGVNPPAELRTRLERRRDELLDRSATYEGVADRARVAARAAYLDRVSRLLEARAERRSDRAGTVSEELSAESEGNLHASYRDRARRSTLEGLSLPMAVDARPSYLTTAAVDSETLPSLPGGASGHALAVRNTNVASVPYADAVGAVMEAFSGPDRVSLGRAAQALRVSGASLAVTNRSNEPHRELSGQVSDSVDYLRTKLAFALKREGLGTGSARRSLVENATARWDHPATAARAFRNGSAAATVHRAAVRKWPALSDRERDILRLRLDAAVRHSLETPRARVGKPAVRDAADTARTVVEGELRRKADDLSERASDRAAKWLRDEVLSTRAARQLGGEFLAKLPTGVPLAPAPGLWYATANFWDVDVKGVYAQFIVRVPRGAPDTPGGFRYVRDGEEARVDVDADGHRERLGRASRIRFATGTDIAVAVPAGPRGVADVDGHRTETSAGWPRPGWE
ncbi:MAG: hypothetical protein V5A13_00620 [Haloarculaceae archaeon]